MITKKITQFILRTIPVLVLISTSPGFAGGTWSNWGVASEDMVGQDVEEMLERLREEAKSNAIEKARENCINRSYIRSKTEIEACWEKNGAMKCKARATLTCTWGLKH